MFILKFLIFLIVLFAVIFNGLLLASNPDLSGAEKSIGIALYVILIIVVGNFIITYVTYFHTKDKIGPVGDPGIEGQKGDKGVKAQCKPSCGRKICYMDVNTHAENVLNNEIQKIRGVVKLKYEMDGPIEDSESTIEADIRKIIQDEAPIDAIPKKSKTELSDDYVTVTKKK